MLWVFVLLFSLGLSFVSEAADLIPRDVKSYVRRRPNHWLDREFDTRLKQQRLNAGCAIALSAGAPGRWVAESHFYLPEVQIEMGLMPAEGGAIWNKNPDEFQFSFPPAVFAELGGRLFKAYSRPVTYLALTQDDGQIAYPNWRELFATPELQKGYSGIHTLKISAEGLPALATAKGFVNAHTLIVEPTKIEQLIAILQSGNFPKMRRIHLIATHVRPTDLSKLFSHQAFRKITELSLAMMNFGDDGMKIIAEASHTARLTALALDVPSHQICPERPTHNGFKVLLHSPKLSHLKMLSVRSIWEWGIDGLEALVDWPGLESLTYLELQNSQSEIAIPRLLQLRKLRKLEELRLDLTTYDDKLLDALANNPELVALRRVVVDLHEDVSRDSVMAIRTALHLRETVFSYDIKP